MQIHSNRFQRVQLGLFQLQSEATHWQRLPREVQQKTVSLLARLLREYPSPPHRPGVGKESRYE
jgi:hypothetical protein